MFGFSHLAAWANEVAVPAPVAQDHYVRALDIRPGNPKVVHHALLFQDITGTARRRDTGHGYPCFGTPGFLPVHGLGGWTPGAGLIRRRLSVVA